MNQSVCIIDGGVGTELQRRGMSMDPCCWSSAVHLQNPEVLLSIHRDYLQAGATILSTNTFMASRHLLEQSGIGHFEEVNRAAVKLALEARARFAESEVLIAGCMSTFPPFDQAHDLPRGKHVDRNFREQALLLADAGVDVLLAEMLVDSETAVSLLNACCETGLPVWVGMSAMLDDKTGELMTFRPPGKLADLPHGRFNRLLGNLSELPIDILGVMHTPVEVMDSALSEVTRTWSGPLLAYAKTGMATEHEWEFAASIPPEEYADHALRWIEDYPVQIVGGCCGTQPEHIEALSRRVVIGK
jgi:5-methyltetrahydrofolate--homocysteine methyltransferase